MVQQARLLLLPSFFSVLAECSRISPIDLAPYSCTFFSTRPSLLGDAQGLAVVVMRAHQNTIAD